MRIPLKLLLFGKFAKPNCFYNIWHNVLLWQRHQVNVFPFFNGRKSQYVENMIYRISLKRLVNFQQTRNFPENFLSKLFRMLLNAFLNVMGNLAGIIKQFLRIPSWLDEFCSKWFFRWVWGFTWKSFCDWWGILKLPRTRKFYSTNIIWIKIVECKNFSRCFSIPSCTCKLVLNLMSSIITWRIIIKW